MDQLIKDFEEGKKEEHNTVVAYLDDGAGAYRLTPYNGLLFIHGIDMSKGNGVQKVFGAIPMRRLVTLAQRWFADSRGIREDRRIRVTPEMVKTVRESKESNRSIAKRLAVSESTVRQIRSERGRYQPSACPPSGTALLSSK